MLSEIIKYLVLKLKTVNGIDTVYGLGRIVKKEDDTFPGVYEKDELVHISFDTRESLSFFLLNGRVTHTREESQYVATEYSVKEVYPIRVILYKQGAEDVNCESDSQKLAALISRSVGGKQKQFADDNSLELVYVQVKDTEFRKDQVYTELFSGDSKLKDNDILIAIDIEVEVSGNEECFVSGPCEPNGDCRNAIEDELGSDLIDHNGECITAS